MDSMDTPTLAALAVFLGGIWAATKGMLEASAFVNALRDTVVIGFKDGQALTLEHRRVLRTDWLTTMTGAIAFPLMYSGFLLILVCTVGQKGLAVQTILFGIACIPAVGSVLFIICGVSDFKLMTRVLNAAVANRGTPLEKPAATTG